MREAQINLLLAWFWILAGVLSGLGLGLFFHQEEWLGGYSSFRRRLYRLGHISFFGLALLNLVFAFTVRLEGLSGRLVPVASWGFVIGAISMPICCLLVAGAPRLRMIFSIPITSLTIAALATCWELIK